MRARRLACGIMALTFLLLGRRVGGAGAADGADDPTATASATAQILPRCPAGTTLVARPRDRPLSADCQDEHHVRHGPAVGYYPSGARKWAGLYVHGRLHGAWKHWNAQGKVDYEAHFWHGRPGEEIADPGHLCPAGGVRVASSRGDEQACLTLGATGQPQREGPEDFADWLFTAVSAPLQWTSRPRIGHAHILLPPGVPPQFWAATSVNYHLDQQDGPSRWWFAPGRLALEVQFHQGYRDGTMTSWYRSGQVRDRAQYAHGELAGDRTYWHADGRVWWQARYQNGQRMSVEGDGVAACSRKGLLPVGADDGWRETCGEPWTGLTGLLAGEVVVPLGPGTSPDAARPWSARAVVVYDGQVLPQLRVDESTLVLFGTDDTADPSVTYRDGELRIHGLAPGRYALALSISSEDGAYPQRPGAYLGYLAFDVETGREPPLRIEVQKILRLREPADSAQYLPSFGRETWLPAGRPIRFRWDSLGADVEYRYRVFADTTPLLDMGDSSRVSTTFASGSTRATEVVLSLPPTAPDLPYSFDLAAFHDGRYIGQIVVRDVGTGAQSTSMAYRFQSR